MGIVNLMLILSTNSSGSGDFFVFLVTWIFSSSETSGSGDFLDFLLAFFLLIFSTISSSDSDDTCLKSNIFRY